MTQEGLVPGEQQLEDEVILGVEALHRTTGAWGTHDHIDHQMESLRSNCEKSFGGRRVEH